MLERPSLNVFIPARQSAQDLGRCLASLGEQSFLKRGVLRVVVVCNACTDGTALIARQWTGRLAQLGVKMRYLDLLRGGRANALNAGEALMGPASGPRVYLDSNAHLSPGALDELADALTGGMGVHFAALKVETSASRTLATRAYARLWPSVPYVHQAGSTMGMYAVSEEGRKRWGKFPAIHSDDKWVRLHFARSERAVPASSTYFVELPEGVGDLYRARVRYERGNREIRSLFPDLMDDEPPRYSKLGSSLLRRPNMWAAAAFVGVVQMAALMKARAGYTVRP